jgi:hypothetical protein
MKRWLWPNKRFELDRPNRCAMIDNKPLIPAALGTGTRRFTMKVTMAFAVLGVLAVASHASEPALRGRWVLTPEAQERFAPACRSMTLEFTEDDRIVRVTGELTYTTSVVVTADGPGWLLKEELQSQNGKPGCGGKLAEEIILHLQREAYVEIRGSVLHYYGVKGAERVMKFKRADAQQARVRDVREARARSTR